MMLPSHDTIEMVGILEITSLSSGTKAVKAHIVYGSCQIHMAILKSRLLRTGIFTYIITRL